MVLDARVHSLHWAGCGCAPPMPLPLPAAVDAALWQSAPPPRAALRVVFLLPHHNLTGGMKMLCLQMRLLKRRGHRVVAVFRGPQGSAVLPPWCQDADAHADSAVLLSPTESYAAGLQRLAGLYDVVMVGYFTQLAELAGVWAPLIYWEQGHEHLFGEGQQAAQWDVVFHAVMRQLPVALAGVSTYAQQALAAQFGRRAALIPNGIDTAAFRPADGAPADLTLSEAEAVAAVRPSAGRVLLVGNPLQAFKGWDVALRALALLHAARPQLRVTWVCQAQPQLHGASFPVDFIVDPPQATLPDVYRLPHDLLLFASRFEARRVTPHRPVAPAPPLPMPHCPLLTS